MNSATLHDAISEVCPIVSTSVGDSDDRATWSYIPTAQATTEQTAAADNVIATIPAEIKATVSSAEFIGRFTNAEYRTATGATWRQAAGNAKNWDVVVFDSAVNFNKKKTVTLRDSLVTDGILTETRASEIFS
jgi:hypothetical protein